MIKACIFDLDGTLLYTLESVARAGNRMLDELGFPMQPVDDYRYYCGDGADNLVKRCLNKVGGYTTENYKSGCILNRKFLTEAPLYKVRPYDGLPEVLEQLKKNDIKLAVFSNKPDEATAKAVYGSYRERLFDVVQGQMPGIPLKPAPNGALQIAEALGVKPWECMYFGDTDTDMRTGKAAGMVTIGVLWGYRDKEELIQNGADQIIDTPRGILSLI